MHSIHSRWRKPKGRPTKKSRMMAEISRKRWNENSCTKATPKTAQNTNASHLRGNCSEDVPSQKRRRQKPAKYQDDYYETESEDSASDNSMDTSRLQSNASKDVPNQKRKRQVPARYQDDAYDTEVRVKAEKHQTDSGSETELNARNGELGRSTPRHSSNSRRHASNDQPGYEMVDTALLGHMLQGLDKMNRRIEELHTKVDILTTKVEGMTNNGCTITPTSFPYLPEDVELPLKSLEELDELNERLKRDKELSSNLASFLYHVGSGKVPRSFMMSLTKKVLTRKVATQFSRFGRKGKKAFIDYNETLNVILAAATMKFKETCKEDFCEIFGKCLAGAVDWDSNRGNRQPRSSSNLSD